MQMPVKKRVRGTPQTLVGDAEVKDTVGQVQQSLHAMQGMP
jgi:hypothetical protein